MRPEKPAVGAREDASDAHDPHGDPAIAALLERALRGPEPVTALLALGRYFTWHGNFELAFDCYERGHRLAPADPAIRRGLGTALCRRGDLEHGLALYEGRWHLEMFRPIRRPYTYPFWHGEPLNGRRLLLWGETGIGDQIMQARCLAPILERGPRVTVECDPRLFPLLARSYPGIEWLPQFVEPHPALAGRAFDFQSSLLSAWRWTLPDAMRVPSRAYLEAAPGPVEAYRKAWRQRGWKINVGLSWRSRAKKIGAEKSIDPGLLRPLLADPRLTLHSLQYGAGFEDVEELGRKLGKPVMLDTEADPLKNLDRLAAQIRALDLVISTSNATVHLAGAMGVPTWTLVPCGNDWRWGEQGETTPLYPGMRLIRQSRRGSWADAVAHVAFAMTSWLEERAADC
jgi:hypothetical protein